MTPPNYFYQKFLEDSFPARPVTSHSKAKEGVEENGSLSIGNTIRKFVLDQSLGAVANTLMFIVLVDVCKGHGAETVARDVRRVSSTLVIFEGMYLTQE